MSKTFCEDFLESSRWAIRSSLPQATWPVASFHGLLDALILLQASQLLLCLFNGQPASGIDFLRASCEFADEDR